MTDEELAALRRDVQEGAEALLRTHRILSQKQARITELEREMEAWRALGRELVALDDVGLRYYQQPIDKVMDKARALLGMANSEGEAQS